MLTSAVPQSTPRDANWLLQAVLQPVRLLATVAVGLAAGFFYAYTVSVTRGLAIVDDRTYVETMQAINSTVRNLPFALSFFGSVVLLVVAVSVGLSRPGRRWSPPTLLTLAALLLYGLGTFVVTFAFSVPLNDELATYTDLASSDLDAARANYEDEWNRWNLVRTLTATAALASLALALLLERRTPPGGRTA
jgi:uncharacterized membrane protein